APPRRRHLSTWLWAAGCSLLLLALAQPQWHAPWDERFSGREFMLAVDLSGSMRSQDFRDESGVPVSRLDLVKSVVAELLTARRGDRAGLIVFGDDAFTLSPVSHDLDLIQSLLTQVRPGMAGERTALGDALALAVARLRDRPAPARSVLLFTDGSNTAGEISPEAATTLAREAGVRLYPVGIGSDQETLYPRGKLKPLLTEIPLNEPLLQQLAAETGGRYYRADRPGALRKVLTDIDKLEQVRLERGGGGTRAPLYWLPLLAGLVVLLAARRQATAEVLP
ncbi:MAG TPA: VWA domain-containing protein, partial [Gammaproteobacteria bacterium]|nr:VWA domain-containing protein [Gammaproteobacteria bacterium]